ncbi:cysteine peptidase family C39 domain-containing protein [Chryseobacterium sp. BIGb0232]|uniref:cysteine peptidase family C39 domain-containing protein n=1 Tax=Chryseobacterium sp. BIGb0232 TaxID=2940598 RepID=UPI000F465047|nr:cysteine peptidase family C39 domain-containing protein [Chryseobacterium sp. BIGb0232]MCS4301686.1 ABC-type bacteriocin/lantibiotic exporter with double-glycine peptidase domain [Chryseobacterium sp. BIGb0232]ROS19460.1 peptidase C39-like protein [Chryseobacterium nakagawai]
MIEKNNHLTSFNFLLKKFIQQNIKIRKIKDYHIPVEDYNFFSFYNILKDDFDIEAMVVKLEHEELEELPFPAIAFLKINGGSFALVNDYKDGKVYWENKEFGKQINTFSLFKRISDTVFLIS